MKLKIAIAGNPNCGKSTLFNALTGLKQYIGNWPGVTVEKKEGYLKSDGEVKVTDLPGTYSLTPYSLEEKISSGYILEEKPDVIINIVDSTALDRSLYLTTQLMDLGIPLVVALNMTDVIKKGGARVDAAALSVRLGCPVVNISALEETGIEELITAVKKAAGRRQTHIDLGKDIEEAVSAAEAAGARSDFPRWKAVKMLEGEESDGAQEAVILARQFAERYGKDIISSARYAFIDRVKPEIFSSGRDTSALSVKIDGILTNKWLAFPVFAAVMFLVYYISVSSLGAVATDWVNDGIFGDGWKFFGLSVPSVPAVASAVLDKINCAQWLSSLITDGVIAGVGAVLGFVPQMLILFFFLTFLEDCGYMARVGFIMDKLFRYFGLSGTSFIPYIIATGCGVPGIMASRTIPNQKERRITIMTLTFIPCSAKLPLIALIAGAIFGGAWWVAPSAYFGSIAAVLLSGIMLSRTGLFRGQSAPFIMELPRYQLPALKNILSRMWERTYSFIKKAGTVILLATVLIWFLSSFKVSGLSFVRAEMEESLLASAGHAVKWIFSPLGWGEWRKVVAAFTGLIAKESVVSTLGVLYAGSEELADGNWLNFSSSFTLLSGYSFLMFNLLCAPCFAALGAIRREMNSTKWFIGAVLYQTLFAYGASFLIYQWGLLFSSGTFTLYSAAALLLSAGVVYMSVRKGPKEQ